MNKLIINIADGSTAQVPLTPEETTLRQAEADTPRVPLSITPRQLRRWLIAHDLLATVEQALAAIPDAQQRALAQADWEYATTIERHHPQTLAIAALISMTSAEVDTLFLEAAQVA